MKNSKKAKIISYVFIGGAVLTFIGGIVLTIGQKAAHLDVTAMWLIASILWAICGIMIFNSAKVLKEKEDSKPRINAFNYGKKRLHK